MNSYEFSRVIDMLVSGGNYDDEQLKNIVNDLAFNTNFYDVAKKEKKK